MGAYEALAASYDRLTNDVNYGAIVAFYEEILKKGLDPEELDVFVEAARSVAGVEIAFSVRQMTPGDEYRFSVRSNGKADVAAICTAFGGGGHIKAAGCSLRAPSMEVAVETFLREAVKQL